MPVSLPTPDQLKRIAEKMNLSLTDARRRLVPRP